MAFRITLQNLKKSKSTEFLPTATQVKQWVKHTLQHHSIKHAEIVIRMVDEDEGKTLNHIYRDKDYATNILSFPYELTDTQVVGDMVLCTSVIAREITDQQKISVEHWAHLIIHGTLHLLGYDHLKDKDADKMQTLEINLLKEMGFQNPY